MQPWALEEPGRDELGEGMLGLRDQTPLGHPAPRPTSHRSEAGLRTHASQREMEVELALPGPLRVTGTPQDRASMTRQTFVGKVISLLFNMLSRFVTAFLPRSKCLLIS